MQEVAQLEINRRAYLQAMGIVQYEARVSLPHAAASPVIPMPVLEEPSYERPESVPVDAGAESSTQGATSAASPQPSSTSANAVSSTSGFVNPFATPAKKNADNSSETSDGSTAASQQNVDIQQFRVSAPVEQFEKPMLEPTKPADVLRFSLYVSSPVKNCVVIAELGSSDAGALAPMEAQFVDDLLRALGGQSGLSQQGCCFKWPMIANSKKPQGLNEAQEALLGFLQKWCASATTSHLLCLGNSQIIKAVAEAGFNSQGAEMAIVQLPGLADVFQDWQQKRVLWQRIQQLLRR